jgi:hypothetical protein
LLAKSRFHCWVASALPLDACRCSALHSGRSSVHFLFRAIIAYFVHGMLRGVAFAVLNKVHDLQNRMRVLLSWEQDLWIHGRYQ